MRGVQVSRRGAGWPYYSSQRANFRQSEFDVHRISLHFEDVRSFSFIVVEMEIEYIFTNLSLIFQKSWIWYQRKLQTKQTIQSGVFFFPPAEWQLRSNNWSVYRKRCNRDNKKFLLIWKGYRPHKQYNENHKRNVCSNIWMPVDGTHFLTINYLQS